MSPSPVSSSGDPAAAADADRQLAKLTRDLTVLKALLATNLALNFLILLLL